MNQKTIDKYIRSLSTMISDSDFSKFLDDATDKIIKYSEFQNYDNIITLLPNEVDYRIVLTEMEEPNSGHWCCLMRRGNKYEWFDSYGVKPDGELNYVVKSLKKLFGEDKHYLSKLIKPIKKNFQYNPVKLQVLKDGINTCGRWTIVRLICFKLGYNLDDFLKFIMKSCAELNKPPDVVIVDYTELQN